MIFNFSWLSCLWSCSMQGFSTRWLPCNPKINTNKKYTDECWYRNLLLNGGFKAVAGICEVSLYFRRNFHDGRKVETMNHICAPLSGSARQNSHKMLTNYQNSMTLNGSANIAPSVTLDTCPWGVITLLTFWRNVSLTVVALTWQPDMQKYAQKFLLFAKMENAPLMFTSC